MARYLNQFLFQDTESTVAHVPAVINETTNSEAVELMFISNIALQASWTVNTYTAQDFQDGDVNTTTNEVTVTAHGFTQGLVVQLTTTGTLPAGLNTGTDYRIDVVDANTIRFLNASTGAVINITGATGGGTHTIDDEALSGASIKLQASNDPNVMGWEDVPGSSTAITAASTLMVNVAQIGYGFVRAVVSLDSGSLDLSCKINGKSE